MLRAGFGLAYARRCGQRYETMKKFLIFFLSLFLSDFLFAEDLCKGVERHQEQEMQIPESEFTYENALVEIEALKKRLSEEAKFDEAWVPLVLSEGYMLKKSALHEMSINSPLAEPAISEFCSFLANFGIYYDP